MKYIMKCESPIKSLPSIKNVEICIRLIIITTSHSHLRSDFKESKDCFQPPYYSCHKNPAMNFRATSNRKTVDDDCFKYPGDFNLPHPALDPKKKHQFFSECQVLIYAMAVCGRFPFHRDSAGYIRYSIFSWAELYWILFYVLAMAASSDILIESFFLMLSNSRVDAVIAHARNCCVLLALVLLPLNHIAEWRNLAGYINKFDAFLVEFQALTGRSFKIGSKFKLYVFTYFAPVGAFLSTVIERNSLGIKKPYHHLMYVLVFCGGFYYTVLFLCFQRAVQQVATYLQSELAKIARRSKIRARVSASELQRLKYLWVKATELLLDSGSATGLSILIIVVSNSVMIIMAAYGLIGCIINYDFMGVFHQIFNNMAGIMFILIGCEAGHISTLKMGENIITTLSAIDISGITKLAAREINVFLQIVSLHPPIITCAGIITLSRSFITSVFSNTITYLIVLVQFKTTDIELARNNQTDVPA